jgi:hypothetical protein
MLEQETLANQPPVFVAEGPGRAHLVRLVAATGGLLLACWLAALAAGLVGLAPLSLLPFTGAGHPEASAPAHDHLSPAGAAHRGGQLRARSPAEHLTDGATRTGWGSGGVATSSRASGSPSAGGGGTSTTASGQAGQGTSTASPGGASATSSGSGVVATDPGGAPSTDAGGGTTPSPPPPAEPPTSAPTNSGQHTGEPSFTPPISGQRSASPPQGNSAAAPGSSQSASAPGQLKGSSG